MTNNIFVNQNAQNINQICTPNSVQSIITSPPYFNAKNYGDEILQIGWKQSYDEYLLSIKDIFTKCFSVTKSSGSIWLVIDTIKRDSSLKLLPNDILNILSDIGWIPQDIVIWDKVKNLPYSRDGQLRNNFEYILFLTKSYKFKYNIDSIRELDDLSEWWVKYPERFNPRGKVPSNIWRIPIPVQGSWGNGNIKHLCPFPPLLSERIISVSTDPGDIILDPFAGSGVTLAQAECMDRNYIGLDTHKKYIDKFYKNVRPEIYKQWPSRKIEIAKFQKKQNKFELFINSLRRLKFAKVILQKAIKEFGKDNFNLFFLESTSTNNNKLIYITIYLSKNALIDKDNFIYWLEKIISVAPLSKYGVESRIKLKYNYPPKNLVLNESNYVYKEGKFYDYYKNGDYEKLKNFRKYPPIISNIKISEKMIKQSSIPYKKE